MDAIFDQLPAMIGVLVGSVATFLGTSAVGRAQWRRERQARWTTMQLAAYTEHAHAVKKMTDLARAVAAHQGWDDLADPLAPEIGVPRLVAAELDRSAKWETVLLVGDPAVVEAGQKWKECVWRLEWFARGRLSGHADWAEALTATGDAKHEYYNVVRQSIGTPGGDLNRVGRAPWIDKELSPAPATNALASDDARPS
ncbi:hypothetical protein ACQP2X_25920 [Actinoplanes sp. CA-131856]